MMTAMTKFVMSAVFGLTMFAAGDAGAARDDGPRHEARGDKMCAKLGCTDAQKAQLSQLWCAGITRVTGVATRPVVRSIS